MGITWYIYEPLSEVVGRSPTTEFNGSYIIYRPSDVLVPNERQRITFRSHSLLGYFSYEYTHIQTLSQRRHHSKQTYHSLTNRSVNTYRLQGWRENEKWNKLIRNDHFSSSLKTVCAILGLIRKLIARKCYLLFFILCTGKVTECECNWWTIPREGWWGEERIMNYRLGN